jgi:vancomycin permeability regulator SanA
MPPQEPFPTTNLCDLQIYCSLLMTKSNINNQHSFTRYNTTPTVEAITQLVFFSHTPKPADVIFCFGTSYVAPVDRTADLYHMGLGKLIVVTGGPNKRLSFETEGAWAHQHLLRSGIPYDAIIDETSSLNTLENVLLGLETMARAIPLSQVHCVLLVTKTYHSRRAYLTARKHFPAHIELLSCPALSEERDITECTWWQSPIGCQTVLGEIERIGRYYQQGMIGDF